MNKCDVFELPPIMKKYLSYKEIDQFLIPIINVIDNENVKSLKEKILQLIQNQELLRIKSLDKTSLVIQEYIEENYKILNYRISDKIEMFQMFLNMQKHIIIEKEFYSMATCEWNGKLFFVALFSHLIYDGKIDFSTLFSKESKAYISNFKKMLHKMTFLKNSTDYKKYYQYNYLKDTFIKSYLGNVNSVKSSKITLHLDNIFYIKTQ